MRWRLALTYVALLALLLAGLGGFQYLALRQSLVSGRVAALQDDMTSARALLGRTATSTARGRVLCATETGVTLVGRAVASTVALTSGHTVGVVVYDTRLQVAAQAPPQQALPRLDDSALRTALLGTRSPARTLEGADGTAQLVVAFPVRTGVSGGSVCAVAQLSTSLAPVDAALRDELTRLVVGGLVALLLALMLGLVLTGRALGGLRRLTASAQRLAAGDLRARSGMEERRDEVGALARAFDHMAGRIEQAFAAQRASEERTRRFIADASHELRTPITALKGYIDVLRRGAAHEPQALEAGLETMAREAERMRVLVLDLLTLARLDAPEPAPGGVADLSDVVAEQLSSQFPGMPEVVEQDLGPHVLARIDPGAAATVVRNLLVNACTYAPRARQRWRTWVEGGRAHLEVSDAGPGIAARDLPHVFERFYRGEKTRAREEGGSGLGLSIVQGLVQAAGGEVSVASREGEGAAFSVTLPAVTPAAPPPAPFTG